MNIGKIISATAFSLTDFPIVQYNVTKSLNLEHPAPPGFDAYDVQTTTRVKGTPYPYGRNVILCHIFNGVTSAITAFRETKDRTCKKINQATIVGCETFLSGYISTFLFMEIPKLALKTLGLPYLAHAFHTHLSIIVLSTFAANYRKQDLPLLFTALVLGGLVNSPINSTLGGMFESALTPLLLGLSGSVFSESGRTIFKQLKEWPTRRLNQLNRE